MGSEMCIRDRAWVKGVVSSNAKVQASLCFMVCSMFFLLWSGVACTDPFAGEPQTGIAQVARPVQVKSQSLISTDFSSV